VDGAAAGEDGDIPHAEDKGVGRKSPPKQSLSGAPSRVGERVKPGHPPESMVGGTIFHRRVIQREISRVLVLNLLWYGKAGGAHAPPRIRVPLTEPSFLSRGTLKSQREV